MSTRRCPNRTETGHKQMKKKQIEDQKGVAIKINDYKLMEKEQIENQKGVQIKINGHKLMAKEQIKNQKGVILDNQKNETCLGPVIGR